MAYSPKHIMNRFSRDEDGNFAAIFALSATVVIGMIGASVDYSIAASTEKRAQNIADTVALSGAIHVMNTDAVPDSESAPTLAPGTHSAKDLGYDLGSFVIDGAEGVDITITYDDTRKMVDVQVSGETETTFSRVLGFETVGFQTSAQVSYMDIQNATPASILMVLDNSGSMAWDDRLAENVRTVQKSYEDCRTETEWQCNAWGNFFGISYCRSGGWVETEICETRYYNQTVGDSPDDAQARIAGLRTSVSTFSTALKNRMSSAEADGRDYVRMGMIPYSSDTLSDRQVPMAFEYLNDDDINAMQPNGLTNSSPPMAQAMTWMLGERQAHTIEATAHQDTDHEPLKYVILMSDGENTVGDWEFEADDSAETWYNTGLSDDISILNSIVYDDEYSSSEYPSHSRGYMRKDSDRLTLESCQAMRGENNDDVHIFTIGFALTPGHYNVRYDAPNEDLVTKLEQWKATNARNMLANCASDSDSFILADNSEELQDAFNHIQNAIAEELIRIAS